MRLFWCSHFVHMREIESRKADGRKAQVGASKDIIISAAIDMPLGPFPRSALNPKRFVDTDQTDPPMSAGQHGFQGPVSDEVKMKTQKPHGKWCRALRQ